MKIIGFTQRVEIVEIYNERRDCADQRIADFISCCGYLPCPLPNKADIAVEIAERVHIDGIILTGGNNLVKYGGDAPERDETEIALIKYCLKTEVPLYGFCRGMQMILDYYACELLKIENHVATRHTIIGEGIEADVNSYHNFGCCKVKNKNLTVLAKSEDGVVEMICHKQFPIWGTMWHPERETPYNQGDIDLVRGLFN